MNTLAIAILVLTVWVFVVTLYLARSLDRLRQDFRARVFKLECDLHNHTHTAVHPGATDMADAVRHLQQSQRS